MDQFNQYEEELFKMAKSYGLGTPESRAVLTAIEHARIATSRTNDQLLWERRKLEVANEELRSRRPDDIDVSHQPS